MLAIGTRVTPIDKKNYRDLFGDIVRIKDVEKKEYFIKWDRIKDKEFPWPENHLEVLPLNGLLFLLLL